MQEQTNGIPYTFTAGQDLRDAEGKAIKLDGTVAVVATAAAAIGVLNGVKPNSGEDGKVVMLGITKCKYGAAVNSGGPVTIMASGFFGPYTQVASGALPVASPVGRALVQVASGDLAETAVNFMGAGGQAI